MNGIDSDDISLLPDVHATSAGLKAFTTWAAHYGIDTCRQACGGHGYSVYSRLPRLFADFAVMCTWEGVEPGLVMLTPPACNHTQTQATHAAWRRCR